MNRTLQASIVAVALSAGWITPVHASVARQNDVQQQLAAMQAKLDQLDQRVDTLEGDLAKERARADAAEATFGQLVRAAIAQVGVGPTISAPASWKNLALW